MLSEFKASVVRTPVVNALEKDSRVQTAANLS
jgi:hypothetical protein